MTYLLYQSSTTDEVYYLPRQWCTSKMREFSSDVSLYTLDDVRRVSCGECFMIHRSLGWDAHVTGSHSDSPTDAPLFGNMHDICFSLTVYLRYGWNTCGLLGRNVKVERTAASRGISAGSLTLPQIGPPITQNVLKRILLMLKLPTFVQFGGLIWRNLG